MSTPAEKIEAQKMAFESQPTQPWHRHLVKPAELEIMLSLCRNTTAVTSSWKTMPIIEPITTPLAHVSQEPTATEIRQTMDALHKRLDSEAERLARAHLARTEDAENDRLYEQWNKKERHN